MTGTRTAATATALTATLGLAAASWVVALWQMNGMDMGVATPLGSFASFVAMWVPMMAAMMLPSAAPAVLRCAHASGHVRAVPVFVGSYLVVWTLVGVAVYVPYRPHGSFAAAQLRSLQVSTSSRRSSDSSAGDAARMSVPDSSSGSTAWARALD
jgi:predicted metal-binding membrane protein